MFGFVERLNDKKKKSLFKSGYNYAKGAYKNLKDPVSVLQNNIDCSKTFGDYNEFEEGIEKLLKEKFLIRFKL